MCWFKMGIAKKALDPNPPLSNGQTWKKKCPKPSWQALTPPGNVGKKCPKPKLSLQAFSPLPPYGQCPYGNNTFQKGASLIIFHHSNFSALARKEFPRQKKQRTKAKAAQCHSQSLNHFQAVFGSQKRTMSETRKNACDIVSKSWQIENRKILLPSPVETVQ